MFLKTLTIKGFKSFADPVTLELEPGITVVVGPNGSGKSNVVDAVAWVLGAQGPRMLRTSRMEDVIFLGSAKRQALGRAEVSLTIDNSSRSLPLDLAEVTITRTLFRSGESEYAINGASCRLLDVQDLLSDAGVGRQQHVIVGQGQVEGVLASRPEERRMVLEEAAGVLKYRKRKERAERRLVATDENIQRISDSLRELRRQVRPLERQAASARAHVRISEELRAVRVYLAGRELAGIEADAGELDVLRAKLQGDERIVNEQLVALDSQEEALAKQLAELRGHETARDLGRVEGLRERVRGLQSVVAERLRSIRMELDASQDEDVVSMLEAEASSLDEELAVVQEGIASAESKLESLASDAEATERELRMLDERWGAGMPGVSGAPGGDGSGTTREAADLRGRLESLELALKRSRVARDQLYERRSGVFAVLEKLNAESDEISDEAAVLAEALERDMTALEEARLQVAQDEKAVQECEARLRSAGDNHRRLLARSEALSLALQRARKDGGVELLEGHGGVVGVLADLVEVDAGWEGAVEAALGPTAGTIVVEGTDAAVAALVELTRTGRSGALLVLPEEVGDLGDPVSNRGLEAVIASGSRSAGISLEVGQLRSHVRVKDGLNIGGNARGSLRTSLERVLDERLASALMVSGPGGGLVPGGEEGRVPDPGVGVQAARSFEQAPGVAVLSGRELELRLAMELAMKEPELVIVTASGDHLAGRAFRVQGEVVDAAPGLAQRAQDEAARQGAQVEAAIQELDFVREALARSRESFSALQRICDRGQERHSAAGSALQRLGAERDRALSTERELSGQIDGLTAEMERDTELSSELSQRLVSVEEALLAQAEHSQAWREARKDLEMAGSELAKEQSEMTSLLAGLNERRLVLSERRARLESRLAGRAQERIRAGERRQSLEAAATAVRELGAVLGECESNVASCAERLSELHRQGEASTLNVEQRMRALSSERNDASERLSQLREEMQRLEIRTAEDRLRRASILERIEKQLSCTPGEALRASLPDLPDGISVEERERKLESDLSEMGPVNLLAVDELSELEERRSFIESQLEDVRSSRRELIKVINAVDLEIATVFTAVFADVNEHFSSLVSALFPDASGRLILTDPDNALETGVELEARLPGRKVRKLSLLSGGERSLVALAFLFAVFMASPSPFYLMDEVEAALDDVNLSRFVTLLDDFRNRSQLIVVSHQKRTMECADALFGVTMAPGESSKVVSERVRRHRTTSDG